MRRLAVVRPLPDGYAQATTRHPLGAIDVALAREQHRAYVDTLRTLGFSIVTAAPHPSPDAVFVEDQAVVARGRALVTRSGHPGRRAEADSVADALRPYVALHGMGEGTLDGGDVLPIGDTWLVGQSGRTDGGGLQALRRVFGELGVTLVGVPVEDLHLKCLATCPLPGLLLVAEGVELPHVAGVEVVVVPAEEAYAANAIGADRTVVLPDGHPRTAALLRARGLDVLLLDNGEIRKGDGALTCCSIRVEDP